MKALRTEAEIAPWLVVCVAALVYAAGMAPGVSWSSWDQRERLTSSHYPHRRDSREGPLFSGCHPRFAPRTLPRLSWSAPGSGYSWSAPGAGYSWSAPGAGYSWSAPGAGYSWSAPGAGYSWSAPGAGYSWSAPGAS